MSKVQKPSTNEDIQKYPLYALRYGGGLMTALWITSTDDYNHLTHHIHHYIRSTEYAINKAWYEERGIKQKLFYVPIWVHEQIHNKAIKNMTDEQFERKFGVSRWEMLFNKKYSEY